MNQAVIFEDDIIDAFYNIAKIWPNKELALKYFSENHVSEEIKDYLRSTWKKAWFIDIAVVCNPNPGLMGIGVYARSKMHGNMRYAEFAGYGNASVANQIAVERAATLVMARSMTEVIVRSNAKFLKAKLERPSDKDILAMPMATKVFAPGSGNHFIWSPDSGASGMKTAKELALASIIN